MKIQKYVNTASFFLFLGSLSLGQLQRIPLGNFAVIYWHDLIGLFWLSYSIWTKPYFFLNLKSVKFSQTYWILLLLASWSLLGIVMALASGHPITLASLYITRLMFYGLLATNLYFQLKEHRLLLSSPQVRYALYGMIVLITWFGWLQYLFLPDTRFLSILGWDDHYFRLISTIFDPSFTGLIVVIGFILGISMYARKQRSWLFFFQILLLGTLALTYSRSSYLALAASGCYLGWYAFKTKNLDWKLWLITGCLLSLFVLMLPRASGEGNNLLRTSTIEARTQNTVENTSLQSFEFLWGKGLFVENKNISNTSLVPDHSRIPDNWLVFWWQGTGIVGLIIWGWYLVRLGQSWILKRPYMFAISLAVLIHGLFNASLTQPFIVLISLFSLVSLQFESNR